MKEKSEKCSEYQPVPVNPPKDPGRYAPVYDNISGNLLVISDASDNIKSDSFRKYLPFI